MYLVCMLYAERDYLTGSTEHAQGSTVYGVLKVLLSVPCLLEVSHPRGGGGERGGLTVHGKMEEWKECQVDCHYIASWARERFFIQHTAEYRRQRRACCSSAIRYAIGLDTPPVGKQKTL